LPFIRIRRYGGILVAVYPDKAVSGLKDSACRSVVSEQIELPGVWVDVRDPGDLIGDGAFE